MASNNSSIGGTQIGSFQVGAATIYRNPTSHVDTITSSTTVLVSYVRGVNSHTGTVTSSSGQEIAKVANPSSHVSTIDASAEPLISVTALPSSHVSTISSDSIREVMLDVATASHINSISSTSSRLVALIAAATSDVHTITSTAGRSGATYFRDSTSHTGPIRSFAHNERTSLELVDYDVTWDDSEASWYTPWTQEFKILGSEDTFVVRSQVVDAAKYPAALLEVQYDENGDGTPDEVSEPIFVGSDERVYEVPDIPVSEDGRYRLKISEYSGYNAIYSLNMGIVN